MMLCYRVSHKLVSGKEGTIEFKTGNAPAISKNRQSGRLLVVNIFNIKININSYSIFCTTKIYFISFLGCFAIIFIKELFFNMTWGHS